MILAMILAIKVALFQILAYLAMAAPQYLKRTATKRSLPAGAAGGIIFSPLVEELIFRGLPLLVFKYNPVLGLVSAGFSILAFTAGHIYQWEKEEWWGNVVNIGWKIVVSVLWTWVTFSTGAIAWAIFLHSLNNACGYTLWHILRRRADGT